MTFVCQQCKQPLQLDGSLIDLTPSAYDVIVSSLPPTINPARNATEEEKLSQLPSPDAVKSAWRQSAQTLAADTNLPSPRALGKQPQRGPQVGPTESYVFLQDSVVQKIPSSAPPHSNNRKFNSQKQRSAVTKTSKPAPHTPDPVEPSHPNPTPLSHHLRSTVRLFSLLSSRTELDHPLCAECTHILLSTLTRQLEETRRERDGYIAFDKETKKEKDIDPSALDEVESHIERLKEEERNAIEELREAQREKERLDEELKALELEEKELEEEEAEFWTAHNAHLLTASDQIAKIASLRAAYAHDSAVLEKLERANVYNDAFCIGHDGVFGTINGLRLGRVGGVTVEWSEINAAWGQALLLLYTIARKLDLAFENYRLVPMGSFSRIEKTSGDKSSYELYGSGDLHLGRLLHNRRFDFAMVAFLDCLRQAMEYVLSQDSTFDFPHQVIKDKIGDVSIKLQFGVEEAWTRALRHVLLALKLLLKWATSSGMP
ncbi:APG6-domain-containing protein [Rickenella mellea]|uniref:APG6-domain-containing protein n=1 Tax=Rickenella mellea TaxID=50990 RepID=A0A4Y7QGI6_9AGAM|nr:APG6-domain-containing protein [Rickenella mellea]